MQPRFQPGCLVGESPREVAERVEEGLPVVERVARSLSREAGVDSAR